MMMIDPVDRDDDEAQDIGEKSRPHPCQGSWTGIMRRFQLQNHDGNENGHNAVAERFDPVRSHAPGNLTRQRSRRKLAIPLEKLAAEPLVVFSRKDYSEVYRILERIFALIHGKPRIAVECDSASSLITEVEAGRGVALALPMLELVAGKRLLYRPLTGTSEVAAVGVARATKGNVTPAREKFCEVLRQTSISMNKSAMRGY